MREREVQLFEESIDLAQKDTQYKGVKTIENFNKEKEAVLKRQVPELHFVFHDKKGNSIVVEYEDNG